MPYTVTLSDGITSLITLPDRAILGPLEVNTSSNCSLNLVGRGASNFGLPTATNFVWLLQNFANATAPVSPLVGQLWYNNTSGNSTLRLYNSSGQWVQVNTADTPIVSSTDIIAEDMLGNSATLGANGTITLIRTNYQPYVKFEGIADSPNAVTLQLNTDQFGNPDLSISSPYFANTGLIWHSENLSPMDIHGDNIINGNNVFTAYNIFTIPTNFSEIIVHDIANTAIVDIKPDSIELQDNSGNSVTITYTDPFTTVQFSNTQTGNFNVIGNAIMLNGNVVITANNLAGLPFLPLVGGTMTGPIVSPSIPLYLNAGQTASVNFNPTTNSLNLQLTGSNLSFNTAGNLSGVNNLSATGTIVATGSITSSSGITGLNLQATNALIGPDIFLRPTTTIPSPAVYFQNASGATNWAYIYVAGSVTTQLVVAVGSENFVFTNTGVFNSPSDINSGGAITATGDITAFSDSRLKSNVVAIDNALHLIDQLEGVRFDRLDTGVKGIGLIAQDVQKVIPELVHENADGMLSIAYGNALGVCINAIKELKARVEELESKSKI